MPVLISYVKKIYSKLRAYVESITVSGYRSKSDVGSQNRGGFQIELSEKSDYEGYIDKFENNFLQGWAVKKTDASAIFELSIYIDGLLYDSLKNDQKRQDLVLHKKSTGMGGFFIQFSRDLFPKPTQAIEIFMPDGALFAQAYVPQQSKLIYHQHIRLPVEEPVSVIVPIYNAAEDLKICIERLFKYTKPEVDIIFIDDASVDKRIQPLLENTKALAAKTSRKVLVYTNKKNLGFTKTVNRGIALAGNKDVVFLNSDARVTPRWLEGLRAALATDARIATVTPMSDRAGAFSAPNIGNENDLPDGLLEESFAMAFRRRSMGFYPVVPTGNGFCLYVRRACLNEIGVLDEVAFPRGYGEENDFCMRARASGWHHVIDDRTYVFHDRNKSFGEEKTDLIIAGRKIIDERYPDYSKAITVFAQSPQILLARKQARVALRDAETAILPRVLFVISTLTGGTPQTNRDLMLALRNKVEPWLLHCDSEVMSLYKITKVQGDMLIAQYTLKEKVDPLTHLSPEYDQVVLNWLFEKDFDVVHIRHLAWHSLNLPKLAKKAGARVIKSFHDFYTVCPTVKLLDNERLFCGGHCTASKGECVTELWAKDAFPSLKHHWVHTWRDKFKEALKSCDAYVTTHQSAKETLLEHLELDESKFHVIPHGRDFETFLHLAEPHTQGEVLRVLVPGNINSSKGSQIIKDLLNLDNQALLEFHVLGHIGFQFEHPRLVMYGEYKREDFAKHVAQIKPHIGAVLSIWNETWCHTLTELWSVGLPVAVTNYPTLAGRVLSSGGGWVLESKDGAGIYNEMKGLCLDTEEIKIKVENVKRAQASLLVEQSTKAMAKRYLEIY